jgi:hypothetical protein
MMMISKHSEHFTDLNFSFGQLSYEDIMAVILQIVVFALWLRSLAENTDVSEVQPPPSSGLKCEHWRCRQNIPPKHLYPLSTLHGVRKTAICYSLVVLHHSSHQSIPANFYLQPFQHQGRKDNQQLSFVSYFLEISTTSTQLFMKYTKRITLLITCTAVCVS